MALVEIAPGQYIEYSPATGGVQVYQPPAAGSPAGYYTPVVTAGLGVNGYTPIERAITPIQPVGPAPVIPTKATVVTGTPVVEPAAGAALAAIPWAAMLAPLLGAGVGWLVGQMGGNGAVTGTQLSGNGYIIPGETGGPGVPEPSPERIVKQWHTKYERRDGRDGMVYFTLTNDGYIYSYDNLSKRQKKWKPKKPIGVVMQGSNMRMKDFLRIDRYLDRFTRRLAKRSSRLALQKR